ncbi:hypothetical protein [Sinosporangium siamense]|uniref:hypothetical protein n=1 Tax=Sinosporangium siamense TaxID=1367973 RepID=UPI001952510B|nr:hypothetical protein [Sinosporangium siamense]
MPATETWHSRPERPVVHVTIARAEINAAPEPAPAADGELSALERYPRLRAERGQTVRDFRVFLEHTGTAGPPPVVRRPVVTAGTTR